MKTVLLAICLITFSLNSSAQIYNTISGTVWAEADGTPNGIRDGGENLIEGVLATMVNTITGVKVAAAISNASGVYTLNNYAGAGDYRIDFSFPSEGYTITDLRSGSNDALNNSADPNLASGNEVSTPDFTVATNTNLTNYGLGLIRRTNTVTYYTSKASTATDWGQTLTLPKSDFNLYGLTNRAVIFATNASFYPILGIENTSTSSGSPTAEISASGSLRLTLPTTPVLQVDANTPSKTANLTIFDGMIDYLGTSGESFLYESGSGSGQRLYTTATDLNSFFRSVGPGTISIPTLVTRTSTFSGGGNLQATSQANSAAGLFVTYRYPTNVVLPINLLFFSARKNAESVLVQWKVAAQLNGTDFKIERSNDGRNFTEIGFVNWNNSNGDQSYQFVDNNPQSGKNIYRLKQVEITGEVNYSASKSVNFGNAKQLSVYPNPATVSLTIDTKADSKILLFTAAGQSVKIDVTRSANQAVLNTLSLQPGAYILQVVEAGVSKAQQIIIQR